MMRMSRVREPIDAGDAGPEVSKRIKNWVMGVRFRKSSEFATDKFYLSLLGSISGHDARQLCCTGLFPQTISIPQVLSFRETLFCDSVHCRIEPQGCLRKVLSDIRFKGICENMSCVIRESQVREPIDANPYVSKKQKIRG
jgi:hypothetical protein